MRERESLIARISQLRRRQAAGQPAEAGAEPTQADEIRALEARVTQLEQLLQGLQDSVHREAERQAKRIGDLETRIEPAALSRALSQDARERGL
ncbi:MAG: hypothetical protein ACJ764_09260 [Solirubrobacteraceae bacterium]